jgi:hypothetical protein
LWGADSEGKVTAENFRHVGHTQHKLPSELLLKIDGSLCGVYSSKIRNVRSKKTHQKPLFSGSWWVALGVIKNLSARKTLLSC